MLTAAALTFVLIRKQLRSRNKAAIMPSTLLEIQKLQFADKSIAEAKLLSFLQSNYDASVSSVSINTKPESLNSLNGIVEMGSGAKYFFKTHTEENEQLSDYYNSQMLSDAGYPMLQPTRIQHKPGQQIALYEVITLPTLFDEIKKAEDVFLQTGQLTDEADQLMQMNETLDGKVFECYKQSLDTQELDTGNAPIHQLFFHRIASGGRIDLFYTEKQLLLDNQTFAYSDFSKLSWTINSVQYAQPLSVLVDRARKVLKDNMATISVVGHGDAHNGNLFVDYAKPQLTYFDPAFAGRHSPFLDLVKPLFHNVFARWMYFPDTVSDEFEITFKATANSIVVEHNFKPTEIRKRFFTSKIANALVPLIQYLEGRGALPADWQQQMRAALFCCPFLTVNLFAPSNLQGSLAERYNSKIKLLGLCMCISMAADVRSGRSEITDMLAQLFD
jgi:hypothetical protein